MDQRHRTAGSLPELVADADGIGRFESVSVPIEVRTVQCNPIGILGRSAVSIRHFFGLNFPDYLSLSLTRSQIKIIN